MTENTLHKIEKTMQSLDGMERAKANPFLYGKIMHRLRNGNFEPVYNQQVVLRYALVVLLLTMVNVVSIYRWQRTSQNMRANNEIREIVDTYFIPSETDSFGE
jgi:hypothetical protein